MWQQPTCPITPLALPDPTHRLVPAPLPRTSFFYRHATPLLPKDLLVEVSQYLAFGDTVNLALTSRAVYEAVPPRVTDVECKTQKDATALFKYMLDPPMDERALQLLYLYIYPRAVACRSKEEGGSTDQGVTGGSAFNYLS